MTTHTSSTLLLVLTLSTGAAHAQSWEGDGFAPGFVGPHVTLDASTTATWDTPVAGDSTRRLRLRRSGPALALSYEQTSGAPAPVALATGLVFMPAALAASGGETLVCWTRFTGTPGPGGAPDPRDGSVIDCRVRRNGQFLGTVTLTAQLADTKALYLMKLEQVGGNLRVVYYEDKLGTLFNQPPDFAQRIFARTFSGVAFGPAAPAAL